MQPQTPFRRYKLDEEERDTDSFTVRLNPMERKQLEEDKKILHQKKDSTAIKQLAALGTNVIHDKNIMGLVDIIQGNKRRNKRSNVVDFE